MFMLMNLIHIKFKTIQLLTEALLKFAKTIEHLTSFDGMYFSNYNMKRIQHAEPALKFSEAL